MYPSASSCLVVVTALVLLLLLRAAPGYAEEEGLVAKRILIVRGVGSSRAEEKSAELLADRILKRSAVEVEIVTEGAVMPEADVTFVVGTFENNGLAARLASELGAPLPVLPRSGKAHPEGFAVKSGPVDDRDFVVVEGTDARGVLYGVGWVLRALAYLPEGVVVPAMDAVEKPAFSLRGGKATGPNSRSREFGNLRPRSEEEHREIVEDLLLEGANCLGEDPDEMHGTYDALSFMEVKLNRFPGGYPGGLPKEWQADDKHAETLVCLSVPEAREALLEAYDKMFSEMKPYDFLVSKSGDPGGCRCERCMPWGGTYIRFLDDVAKRVHKHLPDTKVLTTNQELSDEGHQALLDYLNSHDSSWLYALHYGPGSNEMRDFLRGPVNPRFFEYEGFGYIGNHLKYLHHELPPVTQVTLFPDISHWIKGQYEAPDPDFAMGAVYDRRVWNTRPRMYHAVAQETLHYAVGVIFYTEGMHDDFNKWLWFRLLWDPNQSAEALAEEYCHYWFGPEAAPEAARAMFLMEETMSGPLPGKACVGEAVDLLRSAGEKIPENLLQTDWRWRVMMAKALTDRYIQMAQELGEELKQAAAGHLAQADEAPRAALEKALAALDKPLETAEMKAIRDEAAQRGEESNEVAGNRDPACFLLDRYDLAEVGWWKQTVQEALDSGSEARMRNAARMILRYDDPGEGGYYDNLGWPVISEHLVGGERKWRFRSVFGPSRHSHYSMAYGFKEREAVALEYEGLDPAADYVLRVAVGARFLTEDEETSQVTEGLTADGVVLSDNIPIATFDVQYHEFEIPRELTADGALRIEFQPKSEVVHATAATESWLMKKENMPWTAKPE